MYDDYICARRHHPIGKTPEHPLCNACRHEYSHIYDDAERMTDDELTAFLEAEYKANPRVFDGLGSKEDLHVDIA